MLGSLLSAMRRAIPGAAFATALTASFLPVAWAGDAPGVASTSTAGSTYGKAYSFDLARGQYPASPLLLARDGNFYGTTVYGGSYGAGTVFRTSPLGVTVLHSFIQDDRDGFQPWAGLTQDREGNLWGTTSLGGAYFNGTVFKISSRGTYSVVHSFQGGPADGAQSYAPLVQTADGSLYGTTAFGGASDQGTVFKLSAAGVYSVVHSFSGLEGAMPQWGLTLAKDGQLYGTTVGGGAGASGTAFKISLAGVFTLLHAFDPLTSGQGPSRLIQAKNGQFYGASASGGALAGGTVFRLSPGGSVQVLHAFSQTGSGGSYPTGVIEASDGNLYGTTAGFGTASKGNLFRLTPAGNYRVLHTFSPGSSAYPHDGSLPLAPPLEAPVGWLVGTTAEGGAAGVSPGYGTLYFQTLP